MGKESNDNDLRSGLPKCATTDHHLRVIDFMAMNARNVTGQHILDISVSIQYRATIGSPAKRHFKWRFAGGTLVAHF